MNSIKISSENDFHICLVKYELSVKSHELWSFPSLESGNWGNISAFIFTDRHSNYLDDDNECVAYNLFCEGWKSWKVIVDTALVLNYEKLKHERRMQKMEYKTFMFY